MLRDKKITISQQPTDEQVANIEKYCKEDHKDARTPAWFHRLLVRYLIGCPFEEVQIAFADLVDYLKRHKASKEATGGHYPLLPDYNAHIYQFVGLAYAFDDETLWHKLTVEVLEPEGLDWILDSLIAQRSPQRKIADFEEWKNSYQANVFGRLADVIQLEGEARSKGLKKYLRRWHDKRSKYKYGLSWSPEAGIEDYKGQFAFEVAAVVMAYDVDDSDFCEDIYYPKELVEYWRANKQKN